MDLRLALFLHVPMGLKLELRDVEALLELDDDQQIGGCFGFESPTAVTQALLSTSARQYISDNPSWLKRSRQILLESEDHGIRWSCLGHRDYPEQWLGLTTRPVVFSYKGDPCWQTHEMLAVVGSRTPSSETLKWMQRELSEFLRLNRVGVVSGGARGVDQWSHRICADAGRPTVCILPSGLLDPYPFGSDGLWQRILDRGGCLLSTCSLREPMRKSFFHIRNRWIAGMGRGCFVAEANRRSGSALTAKIAAQECRDICTLPVSPTSTQGLGNLDLIADGAKLLRDQMDLSTFWGRVSRPSALQSPQSDK